MAMKHFLKLPLLLALGFLAIGMVWLYMALAYYGFWNQRSGPAGGFFPSVVSSVLILFSLIIMATELQSHPPPINPRIIIPAACVLLMIAGAYLIGLFPVMTIYFFCWLKYAGKVPWKRNLVITIATVAGFYGIFAVWLGISFPAGLIKNVL
jgi:hypothetical protein